MKYKVNNLLIASALAFSMQTAFAEENVVQSITGQTILMSR